MKNRVGAWRRRLGLSRAARDAPADTAPLGTLHHYALKDRAPRYAVLDEDYGAMYGAYRPAEPGTLYWRIALWLFPFYAMIPTGVLGHQVIARAWVPMDDEHTLFFNMSVSGRTAASKRLTIP